MHKGVAEQENRRNIDLRTNEGFVLRSEEARRAGVLHIFGDRVLVKLHGTDTAGNHAILDCRTEPQCGPPLHRHSREDESFFVVEGEYRFEIDGKELTAGPGGFVFAPLGTAHTFQNIGNSAGRMIIVVQPAGLEAFFTELDAAASRMSEPDMSVIALIFNKHGLELLGPPLSARPSEMVSRLPDSKKQTCL